MAKLNETFARKLLPAKSGTLKYWDSEVRGLVLFVGKQSKTWYFQRDVGGTTKRILIGRYPIISADAARQTAMGLALEMVRGAGKSVQFGAPTLEQALAGYLARPRLRSESHKTSLKGLFAKHLNDWMRLPINEITKAMVAERHRTLADRPSSANHLLRYFRTVWNFARRTHDLPEAPTMSIEWYEERPDGEVITDLKAWACSVDGLHSPIHKVFYELLLYTGFRRTEALTLEWLNVHEGHIHLPMTKNGRSFDLPITQRHHEILAPLRNLGRKWVFPSPRGPDKHLSVPAKMMWAPHAHRRTFATVAMEAGVLEEIVGRLLNHTPLSITGRRYVRPSLDALRPAMDAVCVELDRRLGI